MTKNYKVIKAKFLDFLADPERTDSQKLFAEKNGVNPATLSEWKRDREFKKEFTQRLDSLLTDDLTRLYKLIKEKAFAGDIYWARLYLQQINLLRNYKEEAMLAWTDEDRLTIVQWGEEERPQPIPILCGDSHRNEDSNNQ